MTGEPSGPDDSSPTSAPLIRVSVLVPAAELEGARARFVDLAPTGFEETDLPAGHELAVYVADAAAVLTIFPHATTSEVAGGWEDGWRAFHQPVVAGGIWIGPPWEAPPADVPAVVIDPGRAFGTGAHPTTRLCLELLARCKRGSLLDVGCGSGVLAIAATRLGFEPVTAVDDDQVAVEATRANAERNRVSVTARRLDALADPLPSAEVAVANVLLAPVERILARLDAPTVVTSGYLDGERPCHEGWAHVESVTLDGWAADRFVVG